MTAETTIRVQWAELPAELRTEVEMRSDSPVIEATSQSGGFTSGVAAILRHANDKLSFVKAVRDQDFMSNNYRRESGISARLPPNAPAPRFRFVIDDHGWVLLAFDAVVGILPAQPWQDDQLRAVLDAMENLAEALTPSPIADLPSMAEAHEPEFLCWRELASDGIAGELRAGDLPEDVQSQIEVLAQLEGSWTRGVAGESMIHVDLRYDNLIIDANNRVWVVDWSWPCIGAPWLDMALFLPTIRRPAADIQHLFESHRASRLAPQEDVDVLLAALAGFWIQQSAQPDPAHAPGLRIHQRDSGNATLDWLRERGAIN